MAITDSLNAATAAVSALLAQLKTSNVRVVQAQDTGAADNIVLTPTPSVSGYGPDLLILADIAAPNATTTPKINVSAIGQLTITASDGSAVAIGRVTGKCLFGLSTANGGGYTARLLFSTPTTSGGGGATVDGNTISGSGAPSNSIGLLGDYYLDVVNHMYYGPRGASAWPSGVPYGGAISTAAAQAQLSLTGTQYITQNTLTIAGITGITPSFGTLAAGVFTATVAGLYSFDFSVTIQSGVASQQAVAATAVLAVNGAATVSPTTVASYGAGSTPTYTLVGSWTCHLASGDQVSVEGDGGASSNNLSYVAITSALLNIVKLS